MAIGAGTLIVGALGGEVLTGIAVESALDATILAGGSSLASFTVTPGVAGAIGSVAIASGIVGVNATLVPAK